MLHYPSSFVQYEFRAPKELPRELRLFSLLLSSLPLPEILHTCRRAREALEQSPCVASQEEVSGEWSLPGQGLDTSDTGTSKEKEDLCVYINIYI